MVKEYKCILGYPDCKKGTIVKYHPGTFPEYFDQKSGKRYKASDVEKFSDFWEEIIDYDALLEEAKRRYPVGTKVDQTNVYNGWGSIYVIESNKVEIGTNSEYTNISVGGIGVYNTKNKKWAKIIEPLFYTEDGKPIYEGDRVWVIFKDSHQIDRNAVIIHSKYTITNSGCKIFSSKQAAQDWVDANKPKPKEYEVLELQNTTNKTYWYKNKEGLFICFSYVIVPKYENWGVRYELLAKDNRWEGLGNTLESYLAKEHFQITKIKRLSDGEVFSLGDKVNHKNDKRDCGIIVKFDTEFLKNNPNYNIFIRYKRPNYHTSNSDNYEFSNSLDVLEHYKESKKYTLDEVFDNFKQFMNDKA